MCRERGELHACEHAIDVRIRRVWSQEGLGGTAEGVGLGAALGRRPPFHRDGRRGEVAVGGDRQPLVRPGGIG